MTEILNTLYRYAPVFLQNALLTGYSAWLDRERYGGQFHEFQQMLDRMQWLSEDELSAWQDENLRRLIEHAYRSVPYYRDLFDKHRLRPSDIEGQADLPKVPVLTREDIKQNFDLLWSRDYSPKQLRVGHTSGTTGSPLEVLYDRRVVTMTYALLDRQYRWAGSNLSRKGDRIAVLRGNIIVPKERKYPPFWRYNHFHNQLLLSSFHLAPDHLPRYLEEMVRFRPKVIDGYPSTIYVLARYLNTTGRTFPLSAVITSSETLYDFQRSAIEEAFACRVFDYFAAAERVIFATECDRQGGHHLSSEYGITEVLGADGDPVQKGKSGILAGTSLHNYGMPLIRYVGNDVCAIKEEQCPCGRELPLMEDVTTKAEDMIALRDGTLISPSTLTHPFKPLHSVTASQLVQDDYEKIRIKVVPNARFSAQESEHLIKEFRTRLGPTVNIQVQIVDELERETSGKFKWVISNVDKTIHVP